MDKRSSENIPCTYCDKTAVPGTEPPVCKDHLEQRKEASDGPVTLKELDSTP